jgi:hypothetical protein
VTAPIADRAVLAQAVAAGVAAVPGVARLATGGGTEVATLYPGGKVIGVKVTDSSVAVHIVAARLPLPALIRQVRAAARSALAALGSEHPVDVVVEALNLDLELLPPPAAASTDDRRLRLAAAGQGGR